MFCLDTDVIIGVMTRRARAVSERLAIEIARGTRLIVPAPVLFELRYGAAKSAAPARSHARLDDFLVVVSEIATFDPTDAGEAGDIRAYLESKGIPIGPFDVLIAAQARRRSLPLVTSNVREFSRVPGLIVTDWAA